MLRWSRTVTEHAFSLRITASQGKKNQEEMSLASCLCHCRGAVGHQIYVFFHSRFKSPRWQQFCLLPQEECIILHCQQDVTESKPKCFHYFHPITPSYPLLGHSKYCNFTLICFQDFGSSLLSLLWILFQVDCLFLPHLFGLVGFSLLLHLLCISLSSHFA